MTMMIAGSAAMTLCQRGVTGSARSRGSGDAARGGNIGRRVARCDPGSHHLRVRILVVSTAFPRTRDDPTVKWLAETLRRLVAEGYTIDVLASAYRGGGNTELDGI